MALPLLALIPLGASAAYGLYKTVAGVMDANEAESTQESASTIVAQAKQRAQAQRERTHAMLEDYGSRKLRAFNGVISDFLGTFGRLKNVELVASPELDKLQLGEVSGAALQSLREDYQLLKDSGLGLGAGLTGGAAVAFGAYNGTMMLATAGTGTAISTLSGAAATNATLAWLGGGAIATGGGGMALGTMVLGGLVAAPALAIMGFIVGSKGSEALARAQSNLEQARTFRDEMKVATDQLRAIQEVTGLANRSFSSLSGLLRRAVRELGDAVVAHGEDYGAYAPESREVVLRAVKLAQLVKAMIDTPILDPDGNLVLATAKRVEEIAALAQ